MVPAAAIDIRPRTALHAASVAELGPLRDPLSAIATAKICWPWQRIP